MSNKITISNSIETFFPDTDSAYRRKRNQKWFKIYCLRLLNFQSRYLTCLFRREHINRCPLCLDHMFDVCSLLAIDLSMCWYFNVSPKSSKCHLQLLADEKFSSLSLRLIRVSPYFISILFTFRCNRLKPFTQLIFLQFIPLKYD